MTVEDLLELLQDDYVAADDEVVVGSMLGDWHLSLEGCNRGPGRLTLEVAE